MLGQFPLRTINCLRPFPLPLCSACLARSRYCISSWEEFLRTFHFKMKMKSRGGIGHKKTKNTIFFSRIQKSENTKTRWCTLEWTSSPMTIFFPSPNYFATDQPIYKTNNLETSFIYNLWQALLLWQKLIFIGLNLSSIICMFM